MKSGGADILRATGLEVGELGILDGSPPCAWFSTAGKRSRDWGRIKAYSDTKQRTDDLFLEYVRILAELQPRRFIAENVSGLVKGVGKGWFLGILAALKSAGYRVECRLLDAQWLRRTAGAAAAFLRRRPQRPRWRAGVPGSARLPLQRPRRAAVDWRRRWYPRNRL